MSTGPLSAQAVAPACGLPAAQPVEPLVAQVNWAQPWLAHVPWPAVPCGATVADTLNAASPCPVRFAPADAAPPGEAYEAFIRRTGQVPTRDNLHDLFNGLVWLHFPATKARLNALQAAAIARQGVGAVRGPVRDAITLFDENGAVLLAPEPLWAALLARDWHGLFVTHRALWAQARLVLFGHALMEQLVSPRKSITAHVLVQKFAANSNMVGESLATGLPALNLPANHLPATAPWAPPLLANDRPESHPFAIDLGALDAALAQSLSAERLATKPFTPLPVLGVPGWWPANADPVFYADPSVFRPPRPRLPKLGAAAGTVAGAA